MLAKQNTKNTALLPARTAIAGLIAVVMIVVGLLDVISTNAGLLAGAVEINPIMALTQATFGFWWFAPKLALQLIAVTILILHPVRPVFVCVVGATALNAFVVVNNFALAGAI